MYMFVSECNSILGLYMSNFVITQSNIIFVLHLIFIIDYAFAQKAWFDYHYPLPLTSLIRI
jgi:hypothetical protein